MHLGDPPVIAGQKADQHVGQVVARRAVEPAHDPEIDDRQGALGSDKNVAGMQIGMEKAVAEHLLEKRVGCFAQQIVDRMTAGDERLAVIDPDPGDAFGGQHGAAGALPIDLRHAKSRVAGEILGKLGSGGRLEAQVHLERD